MRDRTVNSKFKGKKEIKSLKNRCYYDWLDHEGEVENIGRMQMTKHCLYCVKVFIQGGILGREGDLCIC